MLVKTCMPVVEAPKQSTVETEMLAQSTAVVEVQELPEGAIGYESSVAAR